MFIIIITQCLKAYNSLHVIGVRSEHFKSYMPKCIILDIIYLPNLQDLEYTVFPAEIRHFSDTESPVLFLNLFVIRLDRV